MQKNLTRYKNAVEKEMGRTGYQFLRFNLLLICDLKVQKLNFRFKLFCMNQMRINFNKFLMRIRKIEANLHIKYELNLVN